jgi:RNA 2',3'-cyclic 3'-phosphodiesterase
VRLFLAINLDASTRRAVYEAAAPLRAVAPGLAWVDESRLHLTLKFLDEQPETLVPAIAAAMDAAAARHVVVPSGLEEFGAFPNFRRARVVWIGMHADPRLELLHHDVEVAGEGLGFAIEARPFRPHVTLARVNHADADALRGLAREAKRASGVRFETTVHSIDLMRSTLGPGGPVYERLHASPLRDR